MSIVLLIEEATSQNNVEYRLNYNKFYQRHIDRSHSLTLLDEINSLLHVALHSVTVTNRSKDRSVHNNEPVIALLHVLLIKLLLHHSDRCYRKYLVYFHVALDRQKKVSLIVLRSS